MGFANRSDGLAIWSKVSLNTLKVLTIQAFLLLHSPPKNRHETKLHIEEKREKLLDWISNVPFNQHHSNIRQDRLPDSGQWLLQKKEYKIWLEDSSCSILWLHGIRMHLR
jgi:hypothetical protein